MSDETTILPEGPADLTAPSAPATPPPASDVGDASVPDPVPAVVDTNADAAAKAAAVAANLPVAATAAAAATKAHPANSGATADTKPVIPGLSAERQAIVDADEAGDVVMDHAAMVAFVGDDAAFSTALDSGEFDIKEPDGDIDTPASEPVTEAVTQPVTALADDTVGSGPAPTAITAPPIPDDATLDAATPDGLVMLMAAHISPPVAVDREHAISQLKAARDGTAPPSPPPIPDNAELHASGDRDLAILAGQHSLKPKNRSHAIELLIAARNAVVAEVAKIEAEVEVWNKDLQAWVKKAV